MEQDELFRRLVVALAIGLLIGLERGWQTREESDHQRTAGLRTFALSGLLGGVCASLSVVSSPLVLGAGMIAFTIALVAFSYLEASEEKNFSVTGVVAGLLTFTLGAYALLGNETVAVGAAVAMAILLALRDQLHSWVRTVTWLEMRSILVLLAMSFLLLPILPNRPVDPWQVLNPSEIWLLAILIAAISFAGYVAVRILGARKGIAVAAIAGGLASSTATTLSCSACTPASRKHPCPRERYPTLRRDDVLSCHRADRHSQARAADCYCRTDRRRYCRDTSMHRSAAMAEPRESRGTSCIRNPQSFRPRNGALACRSDRRYCSRCQPIGQRQSGGLLSARRLLRRC